MTDINAPHPWRIEHYEPYGYLSIVDATGNTICEFFPYRPKGGRGREATLALAEYVLQCVRERPALKPFHLRGEG
jgi:hypothetical protein